VTGWLSVQELADLANISRRKATQALSHAAKGLPWRKHTIVVREVPGRGGRSGVRYEVALASLPVDLQIAFLRGSNAVRTTCDSVSHVPALFEAGCERHDVGRIGEVAANQSERIEYRWRVIQAAVEHPHRSNARAAEIDRASATFNVPVRTIQRWITNWKKAGGDMNAMGRKRPSDAGKPRVAVSRKFDKAFRKIAGEGDATEALLGEFRAIVDQLIRAAWASPAQRAGWKAVRREVCTAFERELRERGIEAPRLKPDAMLSHRRVKGDQDYRIVDIRDHDRKRYDDMKPRITRDPTRLAPMEMVVMDVKPIDCIVTRPDGSTAWPKMIAFYDWGTMRMFRYFALLNRGEGIRQEHVVAAFIEMVSHPEWGFPQQLYRDNGMEFAVLDMVRSALALINEPGVRTIINAKPYNGAAKPIESRFATLDQQVFSQIGGYAGGERMHKKTQTVGKPPAPYPGSFDEFVQEANDRIAVFEHVEFDSGPNVGRSPQGIFADHVANGWRPLAVDPIALDAAFSKRDSRFVDRGAIRINGTIYRHPSLPGYRRQLTIALPWRRDGLPLALTPDEGWVQLQPDIPFLPGDIAGAVESARMQQRADRAVRAMKKRAGKIDLAANHRDRVVALPTRAAPAPIMDVLASQQAQEMAAARIEGERKALAAPDEAERRQARRMREIEELERAYGRRSS
jgi:hypothetical protein